MKASTVSHQVPRPLFQLLDILKPELTTKQIYTAPSVEHGAVKWSEGTKQIIECLDTGAPLPSPSAVPLVCFFHAVLYLLVSLHTPLFICTTPPPFQTGMDLAGWCEHALMQLSKSNYACFVYVMSWARDIVKVGKEKGVTPELMSAMLAPAITQRAASAPYNEDMPVSAAEIIKYLLVHGEFHTTQ